MNLEDVVKLFERRGANQYGSEAVSQAEHALQCAALAAEAGSAAPLVAACLLHDFGHLVAERPHVLGRDSDDVHQYLAIPFLRGLFPESVLEPIRLHVDAKRYLCRTESDYWAGLSPASKHSLELQGGRFSELAAERFLSRPYSWDAVQLRRWDDQAKVPGKPTPSLAEFATVLQSVALRKAVAA